MQNMSQNELKRMYSVRDKPHIHFMFFAFINVACSMLGKLFRLSYIILFFSTLWTLC